MHILVRQRVCGCGVSVACKSCFRGRRGDGVVRNPLTSLCPRSGKPLTVGLATLPGRPVGGGSPKSEHHTNQ